MGLGLGSQGLVMLEVPGFKADFGEGECCITAVMRKGQGIAFHGGKPCWSQPRFLSVQE